MYQSVTLRTLQEVAYMASVHVTLVCTQPRDHTQLKGSLRNVVFHWLPHAQLRALFLKEKRDIGKTTISYKRKRIPYEKENSKRRSRLINSISADWKLSETSIWI